MKRNILYILLLFVLCSCEKQLDIVPKGKVTLGTVSELEYLLNKEYMINSIPPEDASILAGESLGAFDMVSSVLSQTNTVKYAIMAFDESVDRAILTTTDYRYSSIYAYINDMNVVISKMADAQGDEKLKPQLISEARVMRAYMHWLLACYYAKQYDASTAADEGGIAYNTSTSVTETKQKLTLQQTYDMILDDVSDEVISHLPDKSAATAIRGDKAWGYAVRAVVLMQMKRYAEALPYAQKAIELHPHIFDHSGIVEAKKWVQDQQSENNFIWIGNGSRVSPTMEMLSLESNSIFEADDYVIKYCTVGWSADYGESFSGISGVRMFMDWTTQANVWGLTTEQLYYVAAECLIRTGKIQDGLDLVNKIRTYRIENPQPFTASSEAEAMKLMQKAKFVEQLGTTFNYLDIKRWNTEPAYARTVTHRLGSLGTYSLKPNSPLWVFPFPLNATKYNNTLTQNY